MAVQDVARIEERLDRAKAGATLISDEMGGVLFQNMAEVMEFAKLMSLADIAIPKHLRGNPGACLRIVTQALEWRMSPFAVAEQSYLVGDRIGYMAQLVHAVIEQRAPIIGRVRHSFEGEGDERVCIVSAQIRVTSGSETLHYRSPPFGKIQPKNSPLWKTKPDLQQYYNTSRDFCRVYFPDVLLGVYAEDELRDGPAGAKDVTPPKPTPDIAKRLTKKDGSRGFNAEHVERETKPTEPEASPSTASAEASAPPADAGATESAAPSPQPIHQENDPSDEQLREIAGVSPASGVEARAAGHQPPSGPPSIFQQYAEWMGSDRITSPKLAADAHKQFFTRHVWPEDDELQNKFRRIRAIRLSRINNEIDDQKAKALVAEAVAS